ncbi:MAG TPA: tRNA (N6-isopentenyl adenosine(37)-C2)-methylthiotransferase MiaB [Alphaproteobacteria bacterium]|nr:tRNA (N6-isopentenyl adenosine(37)-C2)-methylthiotransferase MiaB [Alphaproteobacteria bacterium]
MPVKIEHAAETPAAAGAKKLFVKSYGCQMNVYDGLRMAELLAPHGYALAAEPETADLIVLNTCHIREKADEKVFSDIGRLRKNNAGAIIAVGGCTGQALGAKIMQREPAVSVVFGPQTYHHLPELLGKVTSGQQKRAFDVSSFDTNPTLEKFDNLPTPGVYGPSAFLTIQEGCDKFCTYCVVPYTRGREISRSAQSIIAEAHKLVGQGAREVTLLGQNVNAYEHEGISLAKLLEMLGEIEGLERLRFTTSHPANTTPDLIAAFANNPKLMPYFHLPVQAGSNKILRAMNRAHTVESYLETIAAVRKARPDIAISGDFIVGFPGETEEDFEQTLALAHAVQYVGAYSFAYSARPGTPAAQMADTVDEVTKKERLAALNVVLDDSLATFAQSFVGQTVPVLVERPVGNPGRYGNQMRGRSPHNLPVNFTYPDTLDAATLPGQVVHVAVTHSGSKALVGTLASR